jgi:hypothetical protein
MKIPTPWPVLHTAKTIDMTQTDAHNNYLIIEGAPVVRYAYSFVQFGRRGSTSQIISPEFLNRTETTLHLAVPNPDAYSSGDGVILGGTVDDEGNYDGGVAYFVDGDPNDERHGPWPNLTQWTGGTVKLRRVT